MSFSNRNENNLVPGGAASRQALSKMRSKLVTANVPRGKQGPALAIPKPASEPILSRRTLKNLAAFVGMVMATANIYAYLEKDNLRDSFYPATVVQTYLAEPGKNWAVDEKATWWAYAAYNRTKFHARFGFLPEGALLNSDVAAAKLDKLLKTGTVKNAIVLSEINRLLAAKGKAHYQAP